MRLNSEALPDERTGWSTKEECGYEDALRFGIGCLAGSQVVIKWSYLTSVGWFHFRVSRCGSDEHYQDTETIHEAETIIDGLHLPSSV